MAYTKQNFVDGLTLSAAELNHIEDGIVALEQAMDTPSDALIDAIIEALPTAEGVNF